MKKIALHNLGCKVNAYETDAMQQLLEKAGYEIVPFEPGADVYIINTCTVTNIADRKSRQMLHKAKKMNRDAIVVAAGCYVQVAKEEAALDPCIDILIGNNNKQDIVAILREYEVSHKAECYFDINGKGVPYEPLYIERTGRNTRAYIKVQDGCNQFCSYCMIPYARGRVRSRHIEDVVREAAALAANGYKEVVVTGIHVGSYGADLGEDETLLELLRAVHQVEGIKRIRLSSLEPRTMSEEFVQALHGMDKLCPHFHLSLQSGCDETLRRMNRHYTTKEYYEVCCRLRDYYEHPAITTDIIAGFPGETLEEFESTKAFVQKVGFYETHVFRYSKRKGTRAADMPGQLEESAKAVRSAGLLELDKANSRRFREYYIGREVEALMEESICVCGQMYQAGHIREYVKVAKRSEQPMVNLFVKGRIIGFLEDDVLLME